VIILHQYDGMLRAGHLFQQSLGELAVTSRYASQSSVRNTGRVCAMWHSGQRPSLAEAVIVALLFFLGEPHTAQSVLRLFRRYAQTIVRVDGVMIRVTSAMSHPGSMAGAQDGLHRGYQSAGGHDGSTASPR